MKKIISYLALLSVLTSMTSCASKESVSYNKSVAAAMESTAITTVVTTNISETSASQEVTTSSVSTETTESTISAVTESAVKAVTEQNLPPVEEKTAARNLPVINSAELVAQYNDYGDGYMYRLDVTGEYAYWNAKLKEISAGQEYSRNVSSTDFDENKMFVTAGSTIAELTAIVTPYDKNGIAGESVTVIWDKNRIEHEAVRFFGNDHDTANLAGFYPYNEKVIEKLGANAENISVQNIEGEWLHGQFSLNIYNCDKTCGYFDDANEEGLCTGKVRLEYTISGNQIQLWYILYFDNEQVFKKFRATPDLPVNEMLDECSEGILHTRIIKN